MKRGTMMDLKRFLITALGALGLGALASGSAFAQIPPPDTFGGQNLTGCLEDPPAAMAARPRGAIERDAGYVANSEDDLVTNLPAGRTFSPKAGCNMVALGGGTAQATIDLSAWLEMAEEAYGNLPDMDDDDYAEELAEFNQQYPGAIFEALAMELSAIMDLEDARDELGDALDELFQGGADSATDLVTGTSSSLNALYRAVTMDSTEAADEDDILLPTVAGVSFTRDTDGDGDVDDDDSGGVVATLGTFVTTTGAGGGDVTAVTLATDGTIGTVTGSEIDFDVATTNLGLLLDARQVSLNAIADAEEALAGHDEGEDAYDFTNRQIADIEEFKEIHEIRVRRLNAAIDTIRGDAATTETSGGDPVDADDIVDAYDGALADIGREHDNGLSERQDRADANSAYRAEFRNPISLLEALISVADNELQEAIDDGDDESDLRPLRTALANARAAKQAYDDAVADTDNPASALLRSLVAADDTGQALIDAVSANHGSTVTNAEAIAALGDNTEEVQANTTKNTEQDTRLDNHEMRISDNETMLMNHEGRISKNTSEIMRVEGRVDSNWNAIEANQTAIGTLSGRVGANEMAIGDLSNRVGSNAAAISRNEGMISDLNDSLEVVRAGVAASMALAGMPAINGRGVSIGIGSYDGESAFAVGFQIQGEMASFKVGVTSAGGETGASAGVGFQF